MQPVASDSPTEIPRGRIVAWGGLVAGMAVLAYGASLSSEGDPPADVLFRWSTALSALVLYAIVLAIVLAIVRGLDASLLGLRPPRSWPRAMGLAAAGFVAILVLSAVLTAAGLDAGEEQGLVPDEWEPGRAAPFAANFVVIAVVAPIVEELLFRGLGFAVVRQLAGAGAAIVVTSLAFGLAHGLVVALPVLAVFGAVLATVRHRTGSVYPPMILHGVFNGAALTAGVMGAG